MSDSAVQKLEDSALWQAAKVVTVEAYAIANQLPDEEKWGMRAKLYQRGYELSNCLAESIGSCNPKENKWQFDYARTAAFSLKGTVILAHKIGYIDAQPQLVIKLQAIVDEIDKEIGKIPERLKVWNAEVEEQESKQ